MCSENHNIHNSYLIMALTQLTMLSASVQLSENLLPAGKLHQLVNVLMKMMMNRNGFLPDLYLVQL